MSEVTEAKTEATTELENALAYFTGTEAYHRFSPLSKLVLTDGVKYLADKTGAYWLMDIIASYQQKCMKDEMLRDFQLWTLKVKDDEGVVTCERDTDDVAFQQKIPFTDFPLAEISLYCINGVILLRSEY
jgi:hypothetical protein